MKSSDELLDEAAQMILAMEDRDIRNEADRKWLRVQLAAMFPSGKEYLVDQVIERALQLASEAPVHPET